MRIAYHANGATLSATALATWISATLANIAAVSSPGVLISVTDPKRPYVWSDADIVADDRRSIGGQRWSRLLATARGGRMEFPTVSEADRTALAAWHAATYGGRVPFVIELPVERTCVAVIADVDRLSSLVGWRRHEIAALDLAEWLP